MYIKLGQFSEAVEDCGRVLEREPENMKGEKEGGGEGRKKVYRQGKRGGEEDCDGCYMIREDR